MLRTAEIQCLCEDMAQWAVDPDLLMYPKYQTVLESETDCLWCVQPGETKIETTTERPGCFVDFKFRSIQLP